MSTMFGCVCSAHSNAMCEGVRPISRTKCQYLRVSTVSHRTTMHLCAAGGPILFGGVGVCGDVANELAEHRASRVEANRRFHVVVLEAVVDTRRGSDDPGLHPVVLERLRQRRGIGCGVRATDQYQPVQAERLAGSLARLHLLRGLDLVH